MTIFALHPDHSTKLLYCIYWTSRQSILNLCGTNATAELLRRKSDGLGAHHEHLPMVVTLTSFKWKNQIRKEKFRPVVWLVLSIFFFEMLSTSLILILIYRLCKSNITTKFTSYKYHHNSHTLLFPVFYKLFIKLKKILV